MMQNRKLEYKNIIFILVILFLPMKFISIYMIFVSLIILIFFYDKKIFLSKEIQILMFFIVFYLLSVLLRNILFDNVISDIKEIMKFIPILMLFLFYKKIKINFNEILIGFLIFIFIDFIVSLIFFLGFDNVITHFIINYYQGEHHIGKLRIVGLAIGPGQHGLIVSLSFLLFFVNYLFNDELKFFSLVGLLFSTILIFLAQSQTSLIAVAMILNILLFKGFKTTNKKIIKKTLIILLVLLSLIIYIFIHFSSEIRYLLSLFEYGLERHSFIARIEKTFFILEMAFKEPFFIFIGWGKGYFGDYARSMDNGYLYSFVVYGWIVMFWYIMLFKYILINLFNKKDNIYNILLFSWIFFGLIYNYPSNFFLKPNIMILLTLIYILIKQNQRNKLNESIIIS